MRSHLVGIARHDDFVRAQVERILPLGFGCREGDGMRAHRMGELDPHMAQATDADDAHLLARTGIPVAQRRIGGDAGTEQRRDRSKLIDRVTDLQHEMVIDDDLLRIAAQRMARRVVGLAIIGAGPPLFAIIFQILFAAGACAAAIDQTAHAHDIAHLEAGDLCPDGADVTDDFMARNAGVKRAAPFGADLMQVGMADAAIGDVDLHIARTYRAPFDRHGFKGFVASRGAIGKESHGGISFNEESMQQSHGIEG